MSEGQWQRVRRVLEEALERPPEKRSEYLDLECAGQPEVRREVESLLAREDSGEGEGLVPESRAEAPPSAEPGRRLSHYEIVSRIGVGGMGEVYRAKDLSLGRDVAVKLVRESVSADPERLERFDRESRAAAALNHPNIATIHAVGEHEGTRFIAMELVEGRTLGQLLEKGPLPVHEVLRLGTQLASGIAKAHAAGILHRDLKPANVMVTDDGLIKILDFGLAKRLSSTSDADPQLTREGTLMGTLNYMSPEQAASQPVDHRSDQFSLGCILYEMATGARAFDKDTMPETLAAIIREEPRPLTTVDASIPAALSAIVKRCLEKDRDRRYASTADLLDELERERVAFSAGVPLPPRRRWRPAVVGLLGVVAAAAGVFSWSVLRPGDAEAPPAPLVMAPLTTYPGSEREPTFSPDGSQVAFSWDGGTGESRDIYVKVVGAEQPLRLTSDPAQDAWPAWSPEGGRIAFLREAAGGGSEVRLVPPIGGPERLVTHLAVSGERGLSWTHDGRKLVVSDRASGGAVVLFLLNVEDGSREQLTLPSEDRYVDRLPVVSPDGQNLAFVGAEGDRDRVYVVPSGGGVPRFSTETTHSSGWGRLPRLKATSRRTISQLTFPASARAVISSRAERLSKFPFR